MNVDVNNVLENLQMELVELSRHCGLMDFYKLYLVKEKFMHLCKKNHFFLAARICVNTVFQG